MAGQIGSRPSPSAHTDGHCTIPLAAQGISGPCTDIGNPSKMTVPAFANLRTVRCSIFSCGACDGRFERVGIIRWECKSVRLEKGPRRPKSGRPRCRAASGRLAGPVRQRGRSPVAARYLSRGKSCAAAPRSPRRGSKENYMARPDPGRLSTWTSTWRELGSQVRGKRSCEQRKGILPAPWAAVCKSEARNVQ